MQKSFKLLFAISLTMLAAFANPVFSEEYSKQFINHSNQNWSVMFTEIYGGKIDINGSQCQNSPAGRFCLVKPGESVDIIFTNWNDYQGHSKVLITDYNGTTKAFKVASTNINRKNDIRIFHSGNTGAVSLNEPRNGDISIDSGDSW